jgi:S-adenosylmethionine:tRNA ribosyltransferase-isomerase
MTMRSIRWATIVMNLEKLLKKYDYSFPPELIAQKPAAPRDAARLLVYDRKTREEQYDTFANIGKYLPSRSVMVFNETKVIPARLTVYKETGGKVNLLYIGHHGLVTVMADRKLEIGATLSLAPKLSFRVMRHDGKCYGLRALFPLKGIFEVLEKYGTTPIPPYIKHSPLSEKKLRKEYQAVFAKLRGSVAAPTASLHFTKPLIAKLKKQGIDTVRAMLHVGLGTFAPLTQGHLDRGKLHVEHYSISKSAGAFLNKAKKEGRPIVAVGTTVARTLESASDAKGKLMRFQGDTDLFIQEGYRWKFVDALVTNFHVPRSSLLMLVAAFISRAKILELYKKATAKRFRLFSFGDGMLVK